MKDVPEGDKKSGEVLFSIIIHGKRANYVCLLDIGMLQSLVDEYLADSEATMKSKRKTFWETKGGKFSTSKKVVLKDCKLLQFMSHRKFDGVLHLFKKKKKRQIQRNHWKGLA